MAGSRAVHVRERAEGGQETTTVELFFDLVYVLAVTQLSHLVIDDLSWRGVGRAGFLLAVVWWAWVNTTWMLNWLDPDDRAVRLAVLGVALVSLVMTAALPEAFGATGGLFAGAYVVLQVGRNAAGRALTRGHQLARTFDALGAWSLAAGVFWLAGGVADGDARLALWSAGLALELAAPVLGYPLPGRRRLDDEELGLPVEGAHVADRFQGFVLIALGESVVVTGATATGEGLSTAVVIALGVGFVQAAALWWLYFDTSAVQAKLQMRDAPDAVLLARDAYTYLHLPIVAGVILSAVGDDVLLAAPREGLGTAEAVVTLAGPVLFLLGTLAFRRRMVGWAGADRPLAIPALALGGLVAATASALAVGLWVAGVLVVLVATEARRQRRHLDSAR